MKKTRILTFIFFTFLTLKSIAQKTYDIEKIIYKEKYDSFWSEVTVKDIRNKISYSKDTLFTEFPDFKYYKSISKPIFKADTINNCMEFYNTAICDKQSYLIICKWRNTKLEKISVIGQKITIDYYIRI